MTTGSSGSSWVGLLFWAFVICGLIVFLWLSWVDRRREVH